MQQRHHQESKNQLVTFQHCCANYTALHYRSTPKETTVVEPSGFLLQVELNPVVKTSHVALSRLSDKHMLKATRVC